MSPEPTNAGPSAGDDADLAAQIQRGDRRALSQAITLVESTRPDHRARGQALAQAVLRPDRPTIRIGVTGSPGGGKSTLIEALGLHAIEAGHRVSVLAVDPSSRVSGGSILGDKTRMSELSRHDHAFIRPSPAGHTLGGVARRTREALLLCEAAGFDVVIVETVGVGQSEVAVSDLVDLFLLIASPAGGDELQGLKRGIMELADVVAVNKADGQLQAAAQHAAADLRNAIHLLRPKRPDWEVAVLTCSALTGDGIPELWETLTRLHGRLAAAGLDELRAGQAVAWMWREVSDTLLDEVRAHGAVRTKVAALEQAVAEGTHTPASAAAEIVDAFLGESGD